MVQKKFAIILLVAAVAPIAHVVAAPMAESTTLDLTTREPEIYERALAFDDAPMQNREDDDAMDVIERSFDDAFDLEQREVVEGIEFEERDFFDALEKRFQVFRGIRKLRPWT